MFATESGIEPASSRKRENHDEPQPYIEWDWNVSTWRFHITYAITFQCGALKTLTNQKWLRSSFDYIMLKYNTNKISLWFL